ncbi:DUF3606 domain-containing protein [Rhizobium leguminosarum bv. viciae]|nr:DUF3606 domain-containing protein [Rhizobium leguminosarum bv. viciae]
MHRIENRSSVAARIRRLHPGRVREEKKEGISKDAVKKTVKDVGKSRNIEDESARLHCR